MSRVRDFAKEDFADIEGDPIPKEKMLFVDLEDGRSFAVRPSGTEPKIQYYLYGNSRPAEGAEFSDEELTSEVGNSLETLWQWLEKDIEERLA